MAKGLFKNTDNMQKSSDLSVNVNDVTRISRGAVITGDIVSSTDIRVDGEIFGTVFSEGKIVVGETARISGHLLCSNLDLWGKLEGEVYVKDTFSVKSLATVSGGVHINKLQVEMGAQFNGTCSMISEQDFEKAVADIVKKNGGKTEKAAAVKTAAAPKAE